MAAPSIPNLPALADPSEVQKTYREGVVRTSRFLVSTIVILLALVAVVEQEMNFARTPRTLL